MTDCRFCGGALSPDVPGWCDACGRGSRVSARTLLGWLLPGATDVASDARDADPLGWAGYAAARDQAREESGEDESVVVVDGALGGSGPRVIAIAGEFAFLGGSMGTAAGRQICGAYDLARAESLPVVLLPASGGARMQEGMASLVQMAATVAAATAHADAGLLQVAVLRDPTTGGVFASHANLAHVVLAEPGATIGFAGPRVSEAMTGGPLPAGSHTAEGALAAGLIDAVVPRPELPSVLARLAEWPAMAMGLTAGSRTLPAVDTPKQAETAQYPDPWDEVTRARAPDRPRAPAFLDAVDQRAELRGDRSGRDDRAVRCVVGAIDGRPVVLIAMDAEGNSAVGPAGYRKAWRAMAIAQQLRVPIVTLIDTPGADASAAAEAGGIAHHIARTFQLLLSATVPVVSLVIGQGGSGGALALAVGDRLLIQEHAIFSVIAPEGAAAILHRDPSRAPEVARQLDPTSRRLLSLGIADEVVPEPHGDAVRLGLAAVSRHLGALAGSEPDLAARAARWRAQPWDD